MSSKSDNRDKKWEQVQIKAFTSWVNDSYTKNGLDPIVDICKEMMDGVKLPTFLECITNKKIKFNRHPDNRIKIIENMGVALRFIQGELGVKLVAIGAEDIADGQLKLILGLLWSMYRRLKLNVIEVDGEKSELGLLSWIRTMTQGYEGVNITTFKESFNDGLAFAALINKFDPAFLDYNALDKADKANNVKLAFETAEKELGIPTLLEVDDMINETPDERSVILYASLYFHAYLSKQNQDKLKEQQDAVKNQMTSLEGKLKSLEDANEELLKTRRSAAERLNDLEVELFNKDKHISDIDAELEYLREKGMKDAESLAFLEEKVNLLSSLLAQEQGEKGDLQAASNRFKLELDELKRKKDELANSALSLEDQKKKLLTDNEEKEKQLNDAEARKNALIAEIEKLRVQVDKEIEKRRNQSKELIDLQRQNEVLRNREINNKKARQLLTILKRNLEEHLEDMSKWKELHQQDLENRPQFDLTKVLADINNKSFEDQLNYLGDKLAEENHSLLRIIKLQDSKLELSDTVLKEGWLLIKGRKEWKKKYFRLRGNRVLYYEDEEVPILKHDGIVNLTENCDIVRQKAIKGEDDKKQWPLKITVDDKKLFIRAPSKKERHSWFFWIQSRIIHLQYLKECAAGNVHPDTRLINMLACDDAPEVHIDNKDIPVQGISALSKSLIAHDEIEKLSLTKSNITNQSISTLGEVLPKLSITSLSLADNQISDLSSINNQNAIANLDLSGNQLTAESLKSFISTYVSSGRITGCLNLSNNSISPVSELIDAILSASAAPHCLCFNGCGLNDDDAIKLAELLKANKGLLKLNINDNNITDEGAKALASAIESSNVTHISFKNNKFGNTGLSALCSSLTKSTSVVEIQLGGSSNVFGGSATAALTDNVYGVADLKFQRNLVE